MKGMRNVFTIMFLALSLVFYGCSDNTNEQDSLETSQVLGANEKNYPQMHELRNELSSLKKELEEHENTIDELKERNPPQWELVLGTVFFIVIMTFVIISYFFKIRNIQKYLKQNRYDIDKLENKIKKISDNISNIKERTVSAPQPFYNKPKTQNEISALAKEKPDTPTIEEKRESSSLAHTEEIKNGYFGMPIGNKYFDKFMTSISDNALFRAYINDTVGEFEVFSLDAIRGIDGIENAVCKEGVSIKDAKHFDVIQKGKVKKNPKGKWDIIAPTRIKLS